MTNCDICTLNHETVDHDKPENRPVKIAAFVPFNYTECEGRQIVEIWHTSRAYSHDRFERMQYVARWFRKLNPTVDVGHKALWLVIERLTTV